MTTYVEGIMKKIIVFTLSLVFSITGSSEGDVNIFCSGDTMRILPLLPPVMHPPVGDFNENININSNTNFVYGVIVCIVLAIISATAHSLMKEEKETHSRND